MTQSATTSAADDASRVVPGEVAGVTRAMFYASASTVPMLRGPTIAYAPEDDGGAAPDAGEGDDGGEGDVAEAPADGEADEVELDEDGNPVESEEELEDHEFEGKTYKLPPEVKRGLLRQADYTQKTQALASERRAFEAERFQQAEKATALRSELGRVQALEDRIEKYRALPWDDLREYNPDEWREARDDYLLARDELAEAKATLSKSESEYEAKLQEATNARLAATNAALSDPTTGIPGWGVEVMRELATFAGQHGVGVADLQEFEASHWKLLHLASLGAKAQQQQQRVAQHKKTQETRPAAPIKGTGAVRDLNAVKSTDEWMRRRNAQVAKRA